MSRRYFGTDGVRGPYGGPVINEDFAARLGFAAARWIGQRANWSVQLNINNALDQTKILPLRVSATGGIVNYRFQSPRQLVLTTKVGF